MPRDFAMGGGRSGRTRGQLSQSTGRGWYSRSADRRWPGRYFPGYHTRPAAPYTLNEGKETGETLKDHAISKGPTTYRAGSIRGWTGQTRRCLPKSSAA